MSGIYIYSERELYVLIMYTKKPETLGHYMHKNTQISSAVKLIVFFPYRFVGRINVYHDRNEPTAR